MISDSPTPEEVRVRKGTALLNEWEKEGVPELQNWINHLDLDHLNISCNRHCVLGQLFGSFGVGIIVLGIDLNDWVSNEHGFSANTETGSAILTAIWIDRIEALRRS